MKVPILAIEFVELALAQDPERRPSARDLLQHGWINDSEKLMKETESFLEWLDQFVKGDVDGEKPTEEEDGRLQHNMETFYPTSPGH